LGTIFVENNFFFWKSLKTDLKFFFSWKEEITEI
jgi:hypothetical protein